MKQNHPAIEAYRSRPQGIPNPLSPDELVRIALEAGADDAALVSLDRPALADEVGPVREALPTAKSLLSFVLRMNRAPIQSPTRSVANLEFHRTGDQVNEIAAAVVQTIEDRGGRAVNPSMGFPMEMSRFPGRVWVVSHKVVAVEAGLGHMGIHRNVIHPRFGNFILLGTVITDIAADGDSGPIDYNPCFECKLCIAACPVGAIKDDGGFDFTACYTHNYREFMGGFTDWVGEIVESKDREEYRERIGDSDSASMWQSLSFGPNYKAAYCMAVCPAGDDVIGPFLRDRKSWKRDILEPLRKKEETVYVLAGTDAENYVNQRFPHKTSKRVRSAIRPQNIDAFLRFANLQFQPEQAQGVQVSVHFRFTGDEARDATVGIANQRLTVQDGHVGTADAMVTVAGATWLRIVNGNLHPVWAVLTGRMKVSGDRRVLTTFRQCFPSK